MRHDEDVGSLPAAERSPGGFRLCTDAAVERLLVIEQMKLLESTLEAMRELLDAVDGLVADPTPARRQELRDLLAGYRWQVSERIATVRERLRGAKQLQDSPGRAALTAPLPGVVVVSGC